MPLGMAVSRSAAASLAYLAAGLLLVACAQAAAASGGPGDHERACGAAFGVLRRCAAAAERESAARPRCCDLLTAFKRNGCLCPDCPEGSNSGATSSKGLVLGAELAQLLDLCHAAAGERRRGAPKGGARQAVFKMSFEGRAEEQAATGEQQQRGWSVDEDDLMADMAGVAGQGPKGRMRDTPAGDYDNLLSDADAAFVLVDPAVARSYASRAADLAADLAADAGADFAAGLGTSEVAAQVKGRLSGLLGAMSAASAAAEGKHPGSSLAEAQEEAASAAAVDDDSILQVSGLVSGGPDPAADAAANADPAVDGVRLAAASLVKRSAEQARAEALALAVEHQQEQRLRERLGLVREGVGVGMGELEPRHSSLQQGDAEDGGDASAAAAAEAAAFAASADEDEEEPSRGTAAAGAEGVKKLSLDIAIDADNPDSAQRMVESIASVLNNWQATGGAVDQKLQEQLVAALHEAAAKVAAAASASAAAGSGDPQGHSTAAAAARLQPGQLLLQQYEEGQEMEADSQTCACMSMHLPELDGPAPLADQLYRRYISARLALCRFACKHQQTLAMLLVAELALCALWVAAWALSTLCSRRGSGSDDDEDGVGAAAASQFVIVSASDVQWGAGSKPELKQPLLAGLRGGGSPA